MESVKAETTLLNHIHHNHQSDHNKSAVLIAANLSSRSTANAMTTTPASRRSNQLQSGQHRAVSRDRITSAAPPVVIVAANSSPSATSTDEISAEEQLPQAGTAKQLLSKWQHNLEAAAATTTTVKRPANDLYKVVEQVVASIHIYYNHTFI
jgi:hypothetical protein